MSCYITAKAIYNLLTSLHRDWLMVTPWHQRVVGYPVPFWNWAKWWHNISYIVNNLVNVTVSAISTLKWAINNTSISVSLATTFTILPAVARLRAVFAISMSALSSTRWTIWPSCQNPEVKSSTNAPLLLSLLRNAAGSLSAVLCKSTAISGEIFRYRIRCSWSSILRSLS